MQGQYHGIIGCYRTDHRANRPMPRQPEHTIIESWTTNADAWTQAVRNGAIESRERATNAAIVAAVMARRPARVLDLGCGEGWLVRALTDRGVEAVGIDGSLALIEAAIASGGGQFRHGSYQDLISQSVRFDAAFDVIVANFALLQEQLTPLLRTLGTLLEPGGPLIIQTVHPNGVDDPDREGWRQEDFRAFPGCWQAMPWFYRTPEGWRQLLRASGYPTVAIDESVHPDSHRPLSLILIARRPAQSPEHFRAPVAKEDTDRPVPP